MNKRLQELYLVASEQFKIVQDQGLPAPYQTRAFAEKFAELIVRECIKESMDEIVADEEIDQEKDPLTREYLKGNNQGVVDAVVRFRNHFGVEQ